MDIVTYSHRQIYPKPHFFLVQARKKLNYTTQEKITVLKFLLEETKGGVL